LDVSKFIETHPGGEDVILEYGGLDLTQAFEDIGHSPEAEKMMDQFLVGYIDEDSVLKAKQAKLQAAKMKINSPSSTDSNFQNLVLPLAVIVLSAAAYYFYG